MRVCSGQALQQRGLHKGVLGVEAGSEEDHAQGGSAAAGVRVWGRGSGVSMRALIPRPCINWGILHTAHTYLHMHTAHTAAHTYMRMHAN